MNQDIKNWFTVEELQNYYATLNPIYLQRAKWRKSKQAVFSAPIPYDLTNAQAN